MRVLYTLSIAFILILMVSCDLRYVTHEQPQIVDRIDTLENGNVLVHTRMLGAIKPITTKAVNVGDTVHLICLRKVKIR